MIFFVMMMRLMFMVMSGYDGDDFNSIIIITTYYDYD